MDTPLDPSAAVGLVLMLAAFGGLVTLLALVIRPRPGGGPLAAAPARIAAAPPATMVTAASKPPKRRRGLRCLTTVLTYALGGCVGLAVVVVVVMVLDALVPRDGTVAVHVAPAVAHTLLAMAPLLVGAVPLLAVTRRVTVGAVAMGVGVLTLAGAAAWWPAVPPAAVATAPAALVALPLLLTVLARPRRSPGGSPRWCRRRVTAR